MFLLRIRSVRWALVLGLYVCPMYNINDLAEMVCVMLLRVGLYTVGERPPWLNLGIAALYLE